ncbi:MAG: tetratricopeptide repeat protein, partial [Planctomycetes bacterium]|nr:tetratricopeptide repeat protein [Planctomycetota bacterium]
MVPVIGLVQVGEQAMADRYTYIPLIGLFITLVWGFADLTNSWRHRKTVSIVTGLIVLGALTGSTWRQVGFWRDSITLFEHSLTINENNHLAHNQIGYTHAENGNFNKAIEHHRLALEIKPDYTKALVNLGRELFSTQQYSAAIPCYQQAIEYSPKNVEANNGLGAAYLGLALAEESIDFTNAENACRAALAI